MARNGRHIDVRKQRDGRKWCLVLLSKVARDIQKDLGSPRIRDLTEGRAYELEMQILDGIDSRDTQVRPNAPGRNIANTRPFRLR